MYLNVHFQSRGNNRGKRDIDYYDYGTRDYGTRDYGTRDYGTRDYTAPHDYNIVYADYSARSVASGRVYIYGLLHSKQMGAEAVLGIPPT